MELALTLVLRPLLLFLFVLCVIKPISWTILRIIPEGKVKAVLARRWN